MQDQVQYGEDEIHAGMAQFILLIPQGDQWDRAFYYPEEKQSAYKNRQPFEGALFEVLEIVQEVAPHSKRFREKIRRNWGLSDIQQAVDRQNVNHNTPLRGEKGVQLIFLYLLPTIHPYGVRWRCRNAGLFLPTMHPYGVERQLFKSGLLDDSEVVESE